jgi:alpha-L-glutamate ligase-like protein
VNVLLRFRAGLARAGEHRVWRSYDSTLGLNGRNDLIVRENPPAAIRLVNDKHATKVALSDIGAPVAPTLALLTSRRDLAALDWDALPPAWALKPNQSLGGTGILLADGRHPDGGWRTGSGRRLTLLEVKDHVRLVLDGEYSPRGRDCALLEPLIRSHPDLDRLSFRGLPDVRVICVGNEPRLAMLRLPTRASGGRANLHQHAIGAAVDLATGRVTRAWAAGRTLSHHPDTDAEIVGAAVPHWAEILEASARCAPATGLHYLGADIVVDAERGPLVLEVNARPGLQIQNVTGRGLIDAVRGGSR